MEFTLCGPKELVAFVPLPEEEKINDKSGMYAIRGRYSYPSDEESEGEQGEPVLGLTENKGVTFHATGSQCLDFFFQIVPGTSKSELTRLLSRAWKEDPLTALKLVFQLRGIRGTGKSDKVNFYSAACWLYEHHPATLAANISKVPVAGYYKDLLELLRKLLETPEEGKAREAERYDHKEKKAAGKRRKLLRERKKKRSELMNRLANPAEADVEEGLANPAEADLEEGLANPAEADVEEGYPAEVHVEANPVEADEVDDEEMGDESGDEEMSDESDDDDSVEELRLLRKLKKGKKGKKEPGYFRRKGAAARDAKEAGTLRPREERVAENLAKGKADKEAASVLRKDKVLKLAKRVVEKHRSEPKFAAVYNSVAEVFAKSLAKDMEALQADGLKARISLAAKWCPSLDLSYDRYTLLCEAIACMYFPKSSAPEFADLDQHRYVSVVRDKLRKEVLVPLRQAMELPEVYMSAGKWQSLPYKRVASLAMKRYTEVFSKHDQERFKKYLDSVEAGKSKIAAGALLPHQILLDAVNDSTGERARVAELQWRTMVDEMKRKGALNNALSICDVSGSMTGEPMDVCIALGMLTSELSDEPWKGKVITFSENPTLQTVQGETLKERYEFTAAMEWGGTTNFQSAFDRILELAQETNVHPDRMVKTVFVYSDMEFNQARGSYGYYAYYEQEQVSPWDTDYMQICRKFREAGYGAPPQIVFWNLRASKSIPVTKDQPGVALVAGYSKNLLKMFMENGADVDPMIVLKQAISGDYYDELVVVD